MNPANAIKSLIPESIMAPVPSEKKEHVAARIVECFQAANPELYDSIEKLESLPEELVSVCVAKVKEAALAAYKSQFGKSI